MSGTAQTIDQTKGIWCSKRLMRSPHGYADATERVNARSAPGGEERGLRQTAS